MHLLRRMCCSSRPVLLGVAALCCGSIGFGQTLIHHYAGGESDGVSAGDAVSITQDDGATGTDLSISGSGVTYSASTYDPASTLAYSFNGNGSLVGTVDSTLSNTAAFIMELRFNATATDGVRALVYNGSTGSSGIGLYFYQDQLQILRGGSSWAPIVTVATSTWNYVALIYDNQTTYAYLNGVLYNGFGNESFYSYDLVDEGLAIGSNELGGDRFAGLIDDVRISTFTSGTFNTSMLAYSAVPEPSTYAVIVGVAFLGFAAWRRRRAAAVA